MSESSAAMPQNNKMGYMPINRLLISMAVPMMISMLVQALYNVVDSIFVAQLSEDALTAVTLAFPMQNLMISVGVGTGVGVNALLSKSLGEKDYAQADRAAVNGLFLNLCSMLVIMLFGFTGVKLFFASQTSDALIAGYGEQYLSICCIFSVGLYLQTMAEKLLVATGKTFYSMLTQLAGALTNIILDPIMIFGLLGCPKMGVAGAAIATVIGQCVGGATGMFLNLRVNREIHLSIKGFSPHKATILRIYSVGVPSIIMQSVGSIMTFCMNKILIAFSSTAVAVFGVYFKLQSFIFMPVFGLNNGMVPILSFNYGARKPDRMAQTIRLAYTYAFLIMLLGFALFQLLPNVFLDMFSASQDMLAIGRPALRIISISFLLAGISVISCSVFQALGHGFLAMVVSVGRQLIVLIPAAYLLSLAGDVNLVWWAFPIAELAAVALCILFMFRVWRRVITPMRKQVEEQTAEASEL